MEVAPTPAFVGARRYGPVEAGAATDFTATIEATGLLPGARYVYRPVLAGPEGRESPGPPGAFETAPAPDAGAGVTFVFSADSAAEFQPFREFAAALAQRPAFFLYLGDTIYADLGRVRATTLDEYRAKYRENREDASLRALLAEVPVVAIWDDHEVENNFNREHPRIPIGRRAFLEHWPIRPDPADPARLYRRLRWGRHVEVFVLDTRQYRSRQFERDGPDKTMLGAAQKAWLLDGLRASEATWKFVATSVGLVHHGADSWEGYATERDEILGVVAAQRIRNVVFLAGDVHYAAFLDLGQGVVEAIAGPIGAIMPLRPPRLAARPEARWVGIGVRNYALVRVPADGGAIEIEWRDRANAVLHRERVEAAH